MARAGVLRTSRGDIHTPAFMPVGTHGAVNGMVPAQLEEHGAEIIVCNAFHLARAPGRSVLRGYESLHKFMGWRRAILTELGRVPGLPAGAAGGARRRRRVRGRRRKNPVAAGGCDRHPGGARLGFRHAARRVHRAARPEGQGARRARPHAALGAALARRRQGPQGRRRRCSASCRAAPIRTCASSRSARSTAWGSARSRSAGSTSARPTRSSARRSTSPSATCRTSGRAT